MGIFSKLFKRKSKKAETKTEATTETTTAAPTAKATTTKTTTKTAAKAPAKKPAAKKTTTKAATTKKAPAKTTTKKPAAKSNGKSNGKDLNPQCGALTASGGQCKNSARDGSKYCGSHKGYRPPAAKTASKAKDTKPATKGAKDTKPSGRRTQVSEGPYKLFQKGNRYFFSKKSQAEAKKDGATPVYSIPAGRTVTKTPNGLPVLKNKN